MTSLTELYPDEDFGTRVWISDQAEKEVDKCKPPDELLVKLESCARDGFFRYPNDWPLRWEGEGVWAVGTRKSLIRIAGFYTDDLKKDVFIVAGAYKKKGQDRGPRGDAVVERVARMKRDKSYEFVK